MIGTQLGKYSIESLLGAISEGKIQELKVVLKVDVKGSLEPVKLLLGRMGTEEVRVKVIHSAVGAVTSCGLRHSSEGSYPNSTIVSDAISRNSSFSAGDQFRQGALGRDADASA